MNLFDKLGITQPPQEGPTQEQRVDDSFRQDQQALMQESAPSQSDNEFKEFVSNPSKITGSVYHDLLTKEPGLAVINDDDDEYYFSLLEELINMSQSMGLDKLRDRLHAKMIYELALTGGRKGKKLELLTTIQHTLSKKVTEVKNNTGWG